jgi:hypothetical protein
MKEDTDSHKPINFSRDTQNSRSKFTVELNSHTFGISVLSLEVL